MGLSLQSVLMCRFHRAWSIPLPHHVSLRCPAAMKSCRAGNGSSHRANARRFISRSRKVGFCCVDSESSVADNGSSGRLIAFSSSFLSSVKIWACSLPSRHGHIGRPLVGRRERLAGHADEDLVHRHALAGMACDARTRGVKWPKSRSMTQP